MENITKKTIEYYYNDPRLKGLILDEIKELREIISKYEQFVTSDQILTENTQFLVPKEKFQLIKESLEKSNKFCYLKFDKNKILREAQSAT
jgi:hypothetical protein